MPIYTNWSKSYSTNAAELFQPESEAELIRIVKQAYEEDRKIRVVGSGHSCAPLNKNENEWLISLDQLNKILNVNTENQQITVQAGISLNTLCNYLTENDLALSNMGTIDAQSIAGALSTGTHGTGITKPALDQQIISYKLIDGKGEIHHFHQKDSEDFYSCLVSMGACGIISEVTIQCETNYQLEAITHTQSFETVFHNMDQYMKSDYFRFWWFPYTDMVQVWQANKTTKHTSKAPKIKSWYFDVILGNYIHEIGLWLTSYRPSLIPRLNKWIYKLLFSKSGKRVSHAHDIFTLDIRTKQMVMEYAVPTGKTEEALKAIDEYIATSEIKVHLPVEVRFAPKNQHWLSMSYNRDTCYIGIITYQPFGKKIPFQQYFKEVHNLLKPMQARAHWAKMQYFQPSEFEATYPKWTNFKSIKKQMDPKGIFESEYMSGLFR